jgi:hypothetical protein
MADGAASFEKLLANNRAPKVSELKTGLLCEYARSDKGASETTTWLYANASDTTHAKLAFCDIASKTDPVCEFRARSADDPLDGGGAFLAGGVYATKDIEEGETVTEYDIQGLDSTLCSPDHESHRIIFDQRLRIADDVTSEDVDAEAIVVEVGPHSRCYHFPGALAVHPSRLGHYINDAAVCPVDGNDVGDMERYLGSVSNNNCVTVPIMGFALRVVASKPISCGEEITHHLGTSRWQSARRQRQKGFRLAVTRNTPLKNQQPSSQETPACETDDVYYNCNPDEDGDQCAEGACVLSI